MNGQTVKILTGKYQGGAGVVLEDREETGMVKVSISGFINGEPVNGEFWLKKSQVELL